MVRRVLQVAADLMLQLREVQAQLRDARETAGPTVERLVRIMLPGGSSCVIMMTAPRMT